MQFWWVPFLLQLDGMPKVTVHFWPPSATKTGELRFVHRHFSIEGKKTLFGPKAHLVRHSESGCKRGVCWKSLHLRKVWRFERGGCGDWFGWMAWEIGEIVEARVWWHLLYAASTTSLPNSALYWTLPYSTEPCTKLPKVPISLSAVPNYLLYQSFYCTEPNSLLFQTHYCTKHWAATKSVLYQTLHCFKLCTMPPNCISRWHTLTLWHTSHIWSHSSQCWTRPTTSPPLSLSSSTQTTSTPNNHQSHHFIQWWAYKWAFWNTRESISFTSVACC